MTDLAQFFNYPLYQNALTRYAAVAKKRQWYIEHKLELYNWAKKAFESNLPKEDQQQAFNVIYSNLKGKWQVFRNARSGYLSAEETFNVLTENCNSCTRQDSVSLLILRPFSPESRNVLNALNALSNIKPAVEYPWMPVSKFTHFFNPKLFPIYDYEVIWKTVLNGEFRTDYRHWCKQHNLNPNGPGANFNLHYMLWAGDTLRQADNQFMTYFCDWFKTQVSVKENDQSVLNDLDQYYATAFEFVAIGAAVLIKSTNSNK